MLAFQTRLKANGFLRIDASPFIVWGIAVRVNKKKRFLREAYFPSRVHTLYQNAAKGVDKMPTVVFENPNTEEEMARYLPKVLAEAIRLKLRAQQGKAEPREALGQG